MDTGVCASVFKSSWTATWTQHSAETLVLVLSILSIMLYSWSKEQDCLFLQKVWLCIQLSPPELADSEQLNSCSAQPSPPHIWLTLFSLKRAPIAAEITYCAFKYNIYRCDYFSTFRLSLGSSISALRSLIWGILTVLMAAWRFALQASAASDTLIGPHLLIHSPSSDSTRLCPSRPSWASHTGGEHRDRPKEKTHTI